MTVEVSELMRDDIVWPFQGEPYVRIGSGFRGHQIKIDPTPAYSHSLALATETLEHVSELFPVPWPVSVYLLPVEDHARTNGATYVDVDYDGPKENDGSYKGRVAAITASAKRIPIHPAMTRYLVPHEYGHVVEDWLNEQFGHQLYDAAILKAYSEVRGFEGSSREYGAGQWHATTSEVFANDFRVLVCRAETEYWPHPGTPHPSELGRRHPIVKWWAARVEEARGLIKEAA